MLHVGYSELKQAFYAHLSASGQIKGISSYLLLFYAVECGFKSIWLRNHPKIKHTSKLQDSQDIKLFTEDGHNLAIWIKELKLSKQELTEIGICDELKEIKYFRLQDKSTWEVENAHQAWRYNVRMNLDDQERLVECLKNLCNLIKDKINQ